MIFVIFEKTLQHLYISLSALFISCAVALPLAFWLSRAKGKKWPLLIIRGASLIQTMPGLAMIALIASILVSIRSIVALPATGLLPGIIALSFYGISPILTNSYSGIKQTSPEMRDVANGMGMSDTQILFLVEIPQAMTMILAGIRIAGVWTIGMCTLTSLIGSGGLGDLILQGLRSMNAQYVLAGTIPAAVLALFFELGVSKIEKWL